MKPIIGKSSVTFDPLITGPAAPPHTYLGVAQGMLSGLKVLADASPPPILALSLVAAHMLECLLKAFLSKDGSDADLKNKKVRHNLNALWRMAFEQGLRISETPPSWADRLSSVHNSPYYLRYSTGVHGIILPAVEPMVSELEALLDLIREQIFQ